jgi:pyruvate dehydrogenase E2 component (dihydrolipoamide acetyltransferase)
MDFLMPKLSDTMEEGTVLQWLKDDGAMVTKGEPIVEIESDKANMMVEAPADGALHIVAQVGDSLPIGVPIATIGEGSPPQAPPPPAAEATGGPAPAATEPEAADDSTGIPTADDGTGTSIGHEVRPPEDYPAAHDDEPDATAPVEVPRASPPAANASAGEPGERVRASPLARRLAEELGVDLAGIRGTGPAGRIVREDVEAAAAGRPVAAAGEEPAAPAPVASATPSGAPEAPAMPGERLPMSRLQRTIARRMAESKPGAPHFYLERDLDVTALIAMRKELVTASPDGQGPSVNDLIVRAVALAVAERPDAVRRFDGDSLVAPAGVHVGVAVTVDGGLMVPVVRDAHTKRVAELAAEIRDLAGRCRDGTITPPELEGSVITVSNLGMFGIDRFAAVINPPEAAILAIGRAKPAAVVVDGEVRVRDMMSVTLSVDHRVLYGAEAATFLGRIAELLERPGALVL